MREAPREYKFHPGPIALFGSGETTPGLRNVYRYLLERQPASPRIALIETPAGFELNSDQVISRIGEYIKHHMQNFDPRIEIIPARRRGTYFSPDNIQILNPLLEADLIFMGPGSPTYAVRQLRDSLAWQMLLARHFLGGAIAVSSAAAIAISCYSLPVYEIFKVGEDLHWKEGLDLFGLYNQQLVFIPHWNNKDGGVDLDTSHCFMGESRFASLLKMLPKNGIVIGIDEQTALVIEPDEEVCHVIGKGGVTLLHPELQQMDTKSSPGTDLMKPSSANSAYPPLGNHYHAGETFSLREIGRFHANKPEAIIPQKVWLEALKVHEKDDEGDNEQGESPPGEVIKLVNTRECARIRKDWETADKLREEIAKLGWEVVDTIEGPQINKLAD